MADNNPRIDELRRRVQADPASIAFAALAEEYRRVGNFRDAIETCVEGLKRHPSYLSARVTLGRALLEVDRFDEAERELQLVLKAAPENLAAIRGMAEIHHRRRDHGYDEAQALSALPLHDAGEPAPPVSPPSLEAPPVAAAPPAPQPPQFDPPRYDPPQYDPPGTFELPQFSAAARVEVATMVVIDQVNPQVAALERFLAAVVSARETVAVR